jgi:hypothetical protein
MKCWAIPVHLPDNGKNAPSDSAGNGVSSGKLCNGVNVPLFHLESDKTMKIITRLEQWKEHGVISAEQHTFLAGLSRGEPFSLFLELNILLYAGILTFVAGLGWTVTTWSQQLGDVLVLTALSLIFAACLWYCFSRAPVWSAAEVPSPGLVFDYVLYLGSLAWSLELTYLERWLHLLSGEWDVYLLATAIFFFFLAYRFDNRFVLSLAFTSLAGWFGLTISHWPSHQDAAYRQYAILYSLFVVFAGAILQRRGWKTHFFGTYLNIAANVLFWALLSGVFQRQGGAVWFLALLATCGACLAWGLPRRQFSFIAYAAVYGYVGVSSILIREINSDAAILSYFVVTGSAMLVLLVHIARRTGREA